jgi:syntaxin 6
LYERWLELRADSSGSSREELEWTTTELRNGLRSIEWDLEDLEETIGIVESNQKKFKLDDQEITNRRLFITQTKEEVSGMRENVIDIKPNKQRSVASLMNPGLSFASAVSAGTAAVAGGGGSGAKYTRLQNEMDSPNRLVSPDMGISVDDPRHQQQQQQQEHLMVGVPQSDLDRIKDSVGNLKNMSRSINRGTEEQAVMLDEMGNDIEVVDSRLDTTLKKMARVLHLKNDRRQWAAISILSLLLLALIVFLSF